MSRIKMMAGILFVLMAFATPVNVQAFSVNHSMTINRVGVPDAYEPNDTKETAYPYASVRVINNTISSVGDLYTLGYRSANLTTPDDVDWYAVGLTQGKVIFADLRNIGFSNYNMSIEWTDTDGNFHSKSTDNTIFNGRPEKYFEFPAPITGTYYIKIYSLGDLSGSNYYFYVGEKNDRVFNISNLQVKGIQIWGSDYQGEFMDFTKYFPKTAKVLTFSLSNNVGGNSVGIYKEVIAGTSTFYSNLTQTDILGMKGTDLYTTMFIAGKRGDGVLCTWSPVASGTFKCDMEPYPGNEVN